jgi:hypothetical protein
MAGAGDLVGCDKLLQRIVCFHAAAEQQQREGGQLAWSSIMGGGLNWLWQTN